MGWGGLWRDDAERVENIGVSGNLGLTGCPTFAADGLRGKVGLGGGWFAGVLIGWLGLFKTLLWPLCTSSGDRVVAVGLESL